MTVTTKLKSCFEMVPRRKGKTIDMKSLNRTINWQIEMAKEQKRLSDDLYGSCALLEKCPICRNQSNRPFAEIYRYLYAECSECGHIFSQRPPSEEAITVLYGEGENKHSIQREVYIDEELFKKRVEQIAFPKIEYCGEIIRPEGLWVDVGCGTGELLMAAKQNGWEVRGIETDPAEIEFANKHGLDVVRGNVNSINPDKISDAKVLSLLNLLEHVREPLKVLKKLVNVLQGNANVVIEVPRHPSLSSFVNLAFPHLAYRHIYAPDHLHVFTEKSMEIMLEAAGLKAVSLWTFGQDFQYLVSSVAVNAGLKESEFINNIIELSVNLQQSIDEMNYSDVMFVIASKK